MCAGSRAVSGTDAVCATESVYSPRQGGGQGSQSPRHHTGDPAATVVISAAHTGSATGYAICILIGIL